MRFLLLAPFCLSLCLLAEDPKPLPEGVSLDILVQEVQGEVDVRPSAKEKWVPATNGMKLAPGAKLCTGVGSGAAVTFGTNSVALVSECTVCEIRTFEMRGEELVAGIHLDPGVAKVSVKQLAQFHTDFQVSTPRLTCSVRGSTGLFRSEGDEIPDWAFNEEGHVGADGRDLTAGEKTNSDGESNHEIDLADNVADTTPDGATENEQDPNQVANNAGNIDLNASDATLNTDPSPSGGDNSTNVDPPPPDGCDPAEVAAAEGFLRDHGLVNLDQFFRDGPEESGLLRKQAQDEWDEVNFNLNTDPIYVEKRNTILFLDHCSRFGGILHDHLGIVTPTEHDVLHAELASEGAMARALRNLSNQELDVPSFQGFHELAHEEGTPSLVTQGSTQRHADFHSQLAENPDGSLRTQQEADYHDAVTGLGAWVANLNLVAGSARDGMPVDAREFQFALIAGEHLEWHESQTALNATQYGMEHGVFHQRFVDALLAEMDLVDPGTWVDVDFSLKHDEWHLRHPEVSADPQSGDLGFDQHNRVHGLLDELSSHAHGVVGSGGMGGSTGN